MIYHQRPSTAVDNESSATPWWADWWAVFLFLVPIIGTFYPPETYFGHSDVRGEVAVLPIPITPVFLVIVCAVIVLQYVSLARRGRVVHVPLAYAFIAWVFVSTTWATDHQFAFQRALRVLPVICLGVIYAQQFSFAKTIRLMIIAFLISAAASVLVGILVPSLGHSTLGGAYESAWRGALIDKNTTGFVYALGVIIIGFGWRGGAVTWRLGLPALLLCIVMVVTAQSATAAVSCVLAIAATGVLTSVRSAGAGARLLVLLLLALTTSLVLIALGAAPELLRAVGRDPTFTGRTEIWSIVWNLILQHPIGGYGYGFWGVDSPLRQQIWQEVGFPVAHSHNSWLDLGIQLGAVGFVLLALVMSISLVRNMAALVVHGRYEASIPVAILIAHLVRSATEAQFTEPSITGLFWVVWTAALARVAARDKMTAIQGKGRRTGRSATLRSWHEPDPAI